MIHTTFSELWALFLWGVFVLVGGLLLAEWWQRRRRWQREHRYQVMCRLCHEVFQDTTPESLVTCPCCGALNERRRPRQL